MLRRERATARVARDQGPRLHISTRETRRCVGDGFTPPILTNEVRDTVGPGVSLTHYAPWDNEKPLSALASVSCACGWLKRPGVFGSRLPVFGEETPV